MKKQNKLGTYLAVTAGVGCAISADASVIIYGVDSANDTNAGPSGVNIGMDPYGYLASDTTAGSSSYFAFYDGVYFTSGASPTGDVTFNSLYGVYVDSYGDLTGGATLSSDNYGLISFDGNNDTYEAVGRFHFDGLGGGFLIALAFAEGTTLEDGVTLLTSENAPEDLSTLTNTSALSINEGFILINAASVPEPSGIALLAVGALGLATRRNRKQAA